jgi:hypothetical protein
MLVVDQLGLVQKLSVYDAECRGFIKEDYEMFTYLKPLFNTLFRVYRRHERLCPGNRVAEVYGKLRPNSPHTNDKQHWLRIAEYTTWDVSVISMLHKLERVTVRFPV